MFHLHAYYKATSFTQTNSDNMLQRHKTKTEDSWLSIQTVSSVLNEPRLPSWTVSRGEVSVVFTVCEDWLGDVEGAAVEMAHFVFL